MGGLVGKRNVARDGARIQAARPRIKAGGLVGKRNATRDGARTRAARHI